MYTDSVSGNLVISATRLVICDLVRQCVMCCDVGLFIGQTIRSVLEITVLSLGSVASYAAGACSFYLDDVQVFLADIMLSEISRSVAVLNTAKNGVTYVTEHLDGVDYLIGASEGAVYSSETSSGRMTPRQSNSSTIRQSYNYMKGLTSDMGLTRDSLFGANYTGSALQGIYYLLDGKQITSLEKFCLHNVLEKSLEMWLYLSAQSNSVCTGALSHVVA